MWLKPFIFALSIFLSLDDPETSPFGVAPETNPMNTTNPDSVNETTIGNQTTVIPPITIDQSPENNSSGSIGLNEIGNDFLTLHLMLTSHTDAGWIYTFEEYYQGQTKYDGGCVKCIFHRLMNSFANNPDRKYDISEISYFNRWWSDLNETQRNTIKEFLKNDQFGFINGAWVANDEAAAYYDDIMENFIIGQRWLKDNLEIDTNVGWQVDSFGNSATHAGLMAQAGYDGLFFSRADYIDRASRIKEKALQYNWAPPNPHNESVFTQMLYLGYTDSRFVIPEWSNCRTIFCNGNLTKNEYKDVERFVKKQAKSFNTKNILLLVCDDFLFSKPPGSEIFYQGAEAMIKHYEEHPEKKIKVKYSHLSDYVAQVQHDMHAQDLLSTIPTKHDDTYPYIEMAGHVWTGYFTSKPMYKMLVREFSAYYNAVKLFLTKALLINDPSIVDAQQDHSRVNTVLNKLEQALSIAQHHDSITGTMKNYVRKDYERMMNEAKNESESVLQSIMPKYLTKKLGEVLIPANITYDWLYQDGNYDHLFNAEETPIFAVLNPGSARTHLIRVKIPYPTFKVLNEADEEIPGDLICHSQDADKDCFIYFADDFPAYSTKVYKIILSTQLNDLAASPIIEDITLNVGDGLTLGVSNTLSDFDYKYCRDQEACTSDRLHLDYYFYESWSGGDDRAASGAYLFSPAKQTKEVYSSVISGKVYKGKHMTLIQIFRDKLRTDIKLIHHHPERGLEIDTFLEPVHTPGAEIVMGIKSNSIHNGNTVFYTDSNGYFMQKRIKNHKDDYDINVKDGLAINYYPMTSNMYIEDEESTQRLSLVTDRAQGVSSMNSGEIEVMIHRVTLTDDWKGVGEALQERDDKTGQPISVTTRHFLSYSQPSVGIKDQRRQQQYDLDRAPHLWFFFCE